MTNQVELNQKAYNDNHREEMERDHHGKVALMHDGEIVHILNDSDDAYTVGVNQYGVGEFSIVLIGAAPTHLGIVGTLVVG